MIPIDLTLNSSEFENQVKKLASMIDKMFNSKTVNIDLKSNSDKVASEIKSIPNSKKVDIKVDTSQADKADAKIKGIKDKVDVDVNVNEKGLDGLKDSFKELGGGATDALGSISDAFKTGGAIGAGIAAVTIGIGMLGDAIGEFWTSGKELNNAFNDMKNRTKSLGLDFNEMKAAAKDAFIGGVGESVAEATQIMTKAAVTLKGVFNPPDLKDFVVNAQAIGKAYDNDVTEVIMKAEPFIKQFGLNSKDSIDLIALAFRDANGAQNDVLDTLSEYSQLIVQTGFSAQEFIGILAKGGKVGVFNTDKIGDAIKETQIRLKAGDIQTALTSFKDKIPKALQKSIETMDNLARSGKITTKAFLQNSLQQIESQFKSGKISEALRTQLQVAIGGTPMEDLGSDISAELFGQPIDTKLVQENAKKAGQEIASLTGQYTNFDAQSKKFDAFFQSLSADFVAFADQFIAPVFGVIMNGIDSITKALKPFVDRFIAYLTPVVTFIRDILAIAISNFFNIVKITVSNFVTIWSSIYDAIKDAIQPIFDLFPKAGNVTDDLAKGFKIFWDIVQKGFDILTSIGKIIIKFIVAPFEILIKLVIGVAKYFGDFTDKQKESSQTAKDSIPIWDKIITVLNNVRGTIEGIIGAFDAIKLAISDFFTAIGKRDIKGAIAAFTGFGEKIKAGYDKGFNSVKENDLKKKAEDDVKSYTETFRARLSKISLDLANKLIKPTEAKKAVDDINQELSLLGSGKITDSTRKQIQAQIKAIQDDLDVDAQAKRDKFLKDKADELKNAKELREKEKQTSIEAIYREANLKNIKVDEAELKKIELKSQQKLLKDYEKIYKITTAINDAGQLVTEFGVKLKKEDMVGLENDYESLRVNISKSINEGFAEGAKFDLKAATDSATKNVEEYIKKLQEISDAEKTASATNDINDYKAVLNARVEAAKKNNARLLLLSLFANNDEKQALYDKIKESNKAIEAAENARGEIIDRVRINQITDLEERSKQLELLALNNKFKEELELYKNNAGKIKEIQIKYSNDLIEINKKYAKDSESIFSQATKGFNDIITNFKFEFEPKVDGKAKQDAIDKVTEIENKIKELNTPKPGADALSYEQLKEQQGQLLDDLAVAKQQVQEYTKSHFDLFKSFSDGIQKSTANVLSGMIEQTKSSLNTILSQQQSYSSQLISLKQIEAQLQIELDNAVAENKLENAQIAYDALVANGKAQEDLNGKQKKSNTDLYEANAKMAILSFGDMVNSGKEGFKSLGLAALDFLDSMIPVWSAQIFAAMVSSMSPANTLTLGIGGTIATAGIMIVLKGLVALARASMSGAETGVEGLTQNYNKKRGITDTIPIWLAQGESVLTTKATKQNKGLATWLNAGNTLESFVKMNKIGFDTNFNYDRPYNYSNSQNPVLINNIQNSSNIDMLRMHATLSSINSRLNKLESIDAKLSHATLVQSVQNVNIQNKQHIVNEIKTNNHRM